LSIPPESIQVGQCYLTDNGKVRRVMALLSGRVQFQQRAAHRATWKASKPDILDMRSFAFTVERAVSCDWTPETDE
jgi:hypothetical protein